MVALCVSLVLFIFSSGLLASVCSVCFCWFCSLVVGGSWQVFALVLFFGSVHF